MSCWLITFPAFLFIPLPAAEPTHPWTSLFNITALCFPHAVTNVLLIAITQLVHPPPLFPYHPLHPHTSAVNGGVRVGARKERGGVRGVRLMKVMVRAIGQRGTVYPLSPCERDSGVSVFGLARVSSVSLPLSLSHSLSRSLSQELLLIKPVCFGRHTVALSSNTLAGVCARRHTRITDTHAHTLLCLFWP